MGNEIFNKCNGAGLISVILLAIIVIIFLMAISYKDDDGKIYTNTTLNSSYDRGITHYCEVTGCMDEGTYKLDREGGKKEYYCYKHYKEMLEIVSQIMGY